MFCVYCGKKVDDNSKYCSHCGKNIEPYNIKEKTSPKRNVSNLVFAWIGFGLGITTFIYSFIPIASIFSFLFAIPGLIFSKYGMNSEKKNFAKKGKTFSILGIIIGTLHFAFWIILIIILEQNGVVFEVISNQWYIN